MADFEGTLVLERLAEACRLEEFWDAVDADDLRAAEAVMLEVDFDEEIIGVVLKKMREPDDEH